jgi:hypothetical protein
VLTAEYDHDGHDYMIVATVADGRQRRRTDLRQLWTCSGQPTALIDLT